MKIDKNYSIKLSLLSFWIWVWVFAIRLYWLIPVVNLVFFWEETVWEVTDLKVYKNDDEYTYKPTVKYNCWGSGVEYSTESASSSYNYSIWRKLTLYCDPLNPKNFYIEGSDRPNLVIIWLLALVFLWWWSYKLWKDLRKLLLKCKLKKIWVVVKAKVDSVKLDYKRDGLGCILARDGKDVLHGEQANEFDTTKKWFNWCYIIAKEWSDVFESGLLSPYIKYIIKPWDDIDVYVNPKNRKQYWVDVDSICNRKIQWDYIMQELGIKSAGSLNMSNLWWSTISSAVLVQHTDNWKKMFTEYFYWIGTIFLGLILLLVFSFLISCIYELVVSDRGLCDDCDFDWRSVFIFVVLSFLLFLWIFYGFISRLTKLISLKKLANNWILLDWIIINIWIIGRHWCLIALCW